MNRHTWEVKLKIIENFGFITPTQSISIQNPKNKLHREILSVSVGSQFLMFPLLGGTETLLAAVLALLVAAGAGAGAVTAAVARLAGRRAHVHFV